MSVWDTAEGADQMNDLEAMKAQRPILEGAGVQFEPITTYEALWTIEPGERARP